MLDQATIDSAPAAGLGDSGNPADRRAHRRIASTELPQARIRIPYRPEVSLVDLSSGGALLELPFQTQPQARFNVELRTSTEKLIVPLQLLRCYVVELKGGVRYHAAGAFEHLLNLPPSMVRRSKSCAVQRLIATLERMRRAGQETYPHSRSGGEFHELLSGAVTALRRGESVALVALKVKSQLTQRYKSLAIHPSRLSYRESLTSAEFFGFMFKSTSTLSAHDRRLLRASAQVLSMMEDCWRETQVEAEARAEQPSTDVIYTATDWMATNPPKRRSAGPSQDLWPLVQGHELRAPSALHAR
jgi:hypothetical protein